MKPMLLDRDILISDGAMGTQLIARGLRAGEASIRWNADRAADILAVHRGYADAGCHCLTTNTFGGSPLILAKYGLEHAVDDLNRLGVHLAREAAEGRCFILGDIGPCGEFLEPIGDLRDTDLSDAVRRQGEVLARAGAEGFIVETVADPAEMHVTVTALKAFDLPIIASYAFERTGTSIQTMMGASPRDAALVALHAGADAVGANCGTSLQLSDYLAICEELLAAAHELPVLLQPNAGMPTATDGGYEYRMTPAEFGQWAQSAVRLGAKIVGGCCGTTPAHIRAAVEAVSVAASMT